MRISARRRWLAPIAALPLLAWASLGAQTSWTPEQIMKVKRVGSVAVSPDGRRVVYEVATAEMEGEKSEWLTQIHLTNADGSGTVQLTRGDKSSNAPAWSPDGQWIAFISARSGKRNVWRLPGMGGEAEQITSSKEGIGSFAWSADGSQIAYLVNDSLTTDEEKAIKEKRDVKVIDENPKLARIYVLPLKAGSDGKRTARLLTTQAAHVGGISWSPDGSLIAFAHQPTPSADEWTKGDVSVVEVASARVRSLAVTGRAESQPSFSPDGKWIALTVSDDPPTWGFTSRVHIVSPAGGESRPLAETYDGQPNIVGWSADSRSVYVTETHRTVNRMSALPVDGARPVEISPADVMVGQPVLNATRTMLGFVSQSSDRPPEAFVSPIARFAAKQVSRAQDLPAAPLGKTEVVTWAAPDGKTIEGLLTYPVDYRAGTPVPLLVIVHGGPTGVFTQSFIGGANPYPIAAFASRGYAVLRCNVRGSSGYGREFRYANYKDWGGGDYKDIMSGVDALVTRKIADPERLGVMGWSYGGYMTSWVITQTKRFKAASVGAGVTNLMSFTGTADIPGFIPDYFGGEYWDVFDLWRTHSAMFNIKGVTTPTLIQHGEADARVPVTQGYELYNALKRQKVPVRMVVYPRQPHGLVEPKFTLDAMRRNIEWFDRYIKGTATATTSMR